MDDATEPDQAPSEPTFVLRWTPTVADWERVIAARRRATGVVWVERAFGLVYLALGLLAVLVVSPPGSSDRPFLWLGVGFVALGVIQLSGKMGPLYRRLFYWRSNPTALLPVEDTVGPSGIRTVGTDQVQEFAWSHWPSLLVLPDYVVLATSKRGNATMNVLPRRALADPSRWGDLIELIRSQVASH